ncbi:MAG: hypothetical protein RLZ14_2068, partial [Actinomycetota bacterium]
MSTVANIDAIVGKRVLVTGVTGWVAGPVAAALAAQGNTVFGAARLRDAEARQRLEERGITPVVIDLAKGDFANLSADL